MKIKFLFVTALLLAVSSISFAQSEVKTEFLNKISFSSGKEVTRNANETAENFAKRNAPPESELVHTVIETEAWGVKKTVFAFYKVEAKAQDGTPVTQVDGYIFTPKSAATYEKILIHSFEEEGDTPKIEAVFFANADKDKAQELVVICSYSVKHYDVSGTLYGTFVFDDMRPGSNPTKLNYLEKISEKVTGGCDCGYRDGTKKVSKYKNAAQVKVGLKKLGF